MLQKAEYSSFVSKRRIWDLLLWITEGEYYENGLQYKKNNNNNVARINLCVRFTTISSCKCLFTYILVFSCFLCFLWRNSFSIYFLFAPLIIKENFNLWSWKKFRVKMFQRNEYFIFFVSDENVMYFLWLMKEKIDLNGMFKEVVTRMHLEKHDVMCLLMISYFYIKCT